jgi:predicted house-cleaning NTP pyrophosphatase (Maf/HAM1 superfamily)
MSFQAINKENPLILASNSPRRKRLLQQIGLPFRSLPSQVDEG